MSPNQFRAVIMCLIIIALLIAACLALLDAASIPSSDPFQ